MTPEQLARLEGEGIPDGTFGGRPPTAPPREPRPPRPPVTPEEAARHREQLLAALDGPPDTPALHLYIVRPEPRRKAS